MKGFLILKSLGMWFVLVFAAILNGTFREFIISPNLGSYVGHIISSFMFIAIILVLTYLFISKLNERPNKKELLLIGLFWLILTIIFEFVFGHFIMGHPWEKLFADYNIFNGRIWSFVLLATLFAPLIIGRKGIIKTN